MYTPTAPLVTTYHAPTIQPSGFQTLGSYGTSPGTQVLGQAGGVGLGAYELVRAKTTSARLGAVHDIAAGVFAATPIGPLIAIQGLLVSTAGAFWERHLARAKLRAVKHRALRTLAAYDKERASQRLTGLPDVFAARLAAASVRHNPEEVAPLGSSSPLYNPRTHATDTPLGLIVEYGEGPAADAVREKYARATEAELAARIDAGQGAIPQPFVRRRK